MTALTWQPSRFGGNTTLGDAANWGGVAPTSIDTLNFNSAIITTLTGTAAGLNANFSGLGWNLLGAKLTLVGLLTIGGTLNMTGGSVAAGSVAVNAGATLSGSGTVTGTITDNGTIKASGGLLTLSGPVGGTGLLQIAAGATLDVNTTSAGQTISFLPGTGILPGGILIDHQAGTVGAAISGFGAGDTIDLSLLAFAPGATATITGGVLTVTSNGASETLNLTGIGNGTSFNVTADANGGTDIAIQGAVAPPPVTAPPVTPPVTAPPPPVTPPATGQTFFLTTGRDQVVGAAGNDTIVAVSGTLSRNDVINGGAGINTLKLSGGGSFNLNAPTSLANIKLVQAQEAAGAAAQTITLRNSTNFTVNVAADLSADPTTGITIIGARNADVINLAGGNDTVILGSSTETVNGGGGNNVFQVRADTIAATINGGGGHSQLVVTGGGTATMGTNISNLARVQLEAPTQFTANAISGLEITGNSAGGDVITLGSASQQVIGGGSNETVRASALNAGAHISGLGAGSTLEITSGGSATLDATTSVATVKLDAATLLQMNSMSFIHAVGSIGADTITAGGIDQTLTGGTGADTLVGYAGGHDVFRDTVSGLTGDTIRGFTASDRIDITDLGFASAQLKAVASGANTVITVGSGQTASFTLAGTFSANGFHLSSDGAAGTILTHI